MLGQSTGYQLFAIIKQIVTSLPFKIEHSLDNNYFTLKCASNAAELFPSIFDNCKIAVFAFKNTAIDSYL